MAKNITKVQGVVIDVQTGGNNGGGGVIKPTPELIEKFEIGDVWQTAKTAEAYYDPEYIAALDTPHPITDTTSPFFQKYKIDIDYNDRVNIKPIYKIYSSPTTQGKFLEYNGGYLYTKGGDGNVYFNRDGSDKNLTPSNGTIRADFNYLIDPLTGETVFYGADLDFAVHATNPEDGVYNRYLTFDNNQDEHIIYIEGNIVYNVGRKGSYLTCYGYIHGSENAPILIWEKDVSEYIVEGSIVSPAILNDELFFQGMMLDGSSLAYHKLNIKTGFITEGIINERTVTNYLDEIGYVNYTMYTLTNTQGYVPGIFSDKDKLSFFRTYYFRTEAGSYLYVMIRFSRARGLEIGIHDYNYYIGECYAIDNNYITDDYKFKNMSYNDGSITNRNYSDNLYGGKWEFVPRPYVTSSHFLGDLKKRDKTSYAVVKDMDTNENWLCEIEINPMSYHSVAYIPALPSGDPDLQYYMRIK